MPKKPKQSTKRLRAADIPDQPLVTTEHTDGHYGEVLCINDVSGQTPVSGGSYYIFLDQSAKVGITLLHPFSLTKFTMDAVAFRQGRSLTCDWNPSPTKLVEVLGKRVAVEKSLGREVQNYLKLLIQHYEKLGQESN